MFQCFAPFARDRDQAQRDATTIAVIIAATTVVERPSSGMPIESKKNQAASVRRKTATIEPKGSLMPLEGVPVSSLMTLDFSNLLSTRVARALFCQRSFRSPSRGEFSGL